VIFRTLYEQYSRFCGRIFAVFAVPDSFEKAGLRKKFK